MSKEVGTPRYLSLVVPLKKVGDEAVHKELSDRMERAATTASSLEAKCQDTILGDVVAQTWFETTSKQSNDPSLSRGYTLGSGEDKLHGDGLGDMSHHKKIYVNPSHTKKIFANMRREGKDFSGRITPLFETMMVQPTQDEGVNLGIPTDSLQTPITTQLSSSRSQKKRVLEENKDRTLHSSRVESSEDKDSLGDYEDASKHGRSIEDIDKDADVYLVDDTQGGEKIQVCFDKDLARNLQAQLSWSELIEEERLARKQEEEANIALIESSDNTQAMMEVVKSKKETEESSKGTGDELESDKTNKVKSSEEKAKGSRKKIIADGSSKRYSSMIRMLQDIDREDLQTLWKLVKTKHGDIRPEDEHERVLWGDLKCMTRSSTKELSTPFKDTEREFRSSRKHFKTLSLDESRSPDFDLFSDQEEYSEEEVAETMAETIEQYMSKTRADYGSGVVRPKIKDNDSFELKGQFFMELRDNTFSGSDHKDANEHI
ncbi:hypothetical protein Tco_0550631 [Tanacetum coccineum]